MVAQKQIMTHQFVSNPDPRLSYYRFESPKTTFSIFPNLGASLLDWTYHGVPILAPFPITEAGIEQYQNDYQSSILFPFPNRLENGQFSHEGENFELPINEPILNNAIHGCVSNCSFSVIEVSSHSIQLNYMHEPNQSFPFGFSLEVSYQFSEESVSIQFKIINLDKKSFPFGLGWHPYFRIEGDGKDTIHFTSDKTYAMNKHMIPTNSQMVANESMLLNNELDTPYRLTHPDIILNTKDYHLKLETKEFDYLQLYIPKNRKSIAIEPMTCISNSFNNGIGRKHLEPAASFTSNLTLRVINQN